MISGLSKVVCFGTRTQLLKMSEAKKLKLDSINGFMEELSNRRRECAESVQDFKFNKSRCRVITKEEDMPEDAGGVLYWMVRDHRVQDNWSMLFAQRQAMKYKVPLHVCFCFSNALLECTLRHANFMLTGIREVAEECSVLGISFHLLNGEAHTEIPKVVNQFKIGSIIVDFLPLKAPMKWLDDVKKKVSIPICQVDAHNVVPCWVTSDKQEYAARTIRNKIHSKLKVFLTEFPPVIKHPHVGKIESQEIDWDAVLLQSTFLDSDVKPVEWAVPGTKAGLKVLEKFVSSGLKNYAEKRNDPTCDGLSNLSPWFHFGQISVQRAILTTNQYRSKYQQSVDAFVEESLVRRELADNFCYYNIKYDEIDGAYDWAKQTLKIHAEDKRPYVYSLDEFEQGHTHDDFWNAAQNQLVQEGKMHGYVRMYWAKKILEWSESPKEALRIAIQLNDKYSLDGCDPNGFTGVMWSICGIHDQGWAERPVFGKIRCMTYDGLKRKFKMDNYIIKYKGKKYPYKKK